MLAEHNPEFIPPIKSDELLPEISRWTTLGGLGLLGTCGCALILATVLKYPITVKAAATVRPAGELRIVEAGTQGIVNEILVSENQPVTKGQAIATIDSTQLKTRKSQIFLNIRQNQLQLRQMDAQIKALQTQVTAESNAMNRAIASAQADLSRSQREYQDRRTITQAEVQEAAATLELAQEEMTRYRDLGGVGAISKLQIKEKEQAYKAAQARLQRAKVGLNPTAALVAMAQERIAQEKARGESTLAALQKERESLLQRQIEIENQIQRDGQELKQVLTELQKSIIRTVEAGIVLKLELRNASQFVRPGQAIAQIAPKNAPLVIKARVAAQDISKVKVCTSKQVAKCQQGKVQMRISAYPYPDYGTLSGAVRTITADTVAPPTRVASTAGNAGINAPYYEVSIEPERLDLEKDGKTYPIQPGMEVTADILSKEETVLTFILRKARLLADV